MGATIIKGLSTEVINFILSNENYGYLLFLT